MNRDRLFCNVFRIDIDKYNKHLYRLLGILLKENNKLKNANDLIFHKKHNSEIRETKF